MKKFTRINENKVNDTINVTINMPVSPETSNLIIDAILKIYPSEEDLMRYGYEKAVSKVMLVYYNQKLMYANDPGEFESQLNSMEEEWIGQLFLDDLGSQHGI
jgi:hypothetical protein